jgi:hypothetical protein
MNQMYAAQPPKEFKTTMDYKGQQIEKAQRSTQESIRVSGSATDATLIVAALISKMKVEPDTDDIEALWQYWRKYFFKERDIEETYKSLTQHF